MRKLLFLLCLLPIFSNSQIKSGTITYGVSLEFEDDLKKGMMSEYVEKATENAKYYTFNLDFNQEAMRFYAQENMTFDSGKNSFVLAFCSGFGVYYKNRNLNENYHEFSIEELGDFILILNESQKWELTNESKMINNLLCYRANTEQLVNTDTGIFKFPIIAWYCPEIPLPYGPKEFGGLPGLILELQERNALFGVKKIELSSSKKIEIEKPIKGKLTTEAEFKKINVEHSKLMQNAN